MSNFKPIVTIVISLAYLCLVQAKGIDIPSGNVLIKNVRGIGTQNYVCTKGKFEFKEPVADLLEPDNLSNNAGKHFFNPKPDAKGGKAVFEIGSSKAVFKVDGTLPSTNPKNIPELKLIATSTSGALLKDCTFATRRNTVGGVAPTTACKDGEVVKVRYQADYSFFGKGKPGQTTTGSTPGNDPGAIIPKNLKGTDVPGNNIQFKKVHAKGTQIYECKSGKFGIKDEKAVFSEFDDKSDREGVILSRNVYVINESKLTVRQVGEKKSSDPKNLPEALFASRSSSPGTLGEVTFVLRTKVVGGSAPTGKCTGTKTESVPFEADYIFFRAKGTKKKRSVGRYMPMSL